MDKQQLIRELIADVPDFPKPGILFRDITPLLADVAGFRAATELLAGPFPLAGIDYLAGIESRGFIFGAAMAQRFDLGLVLVRKRGKLPRRTEAVTYDLEYGTDTVEIHADAISPGKRVLLVDDLLATGGTAAAAVELLRKVGATVVGATFVIELAGLKGRERLGGIDAHALITY